MAGFQFRLDSVLEWYRKQCQIEKDRLAACLALVSRARESRSRLEAERASIEQETIARPDLRSTDLVALDLYRLRATQRHAEMTGQIQRLETAAAEQRGRYMAAERRQKLLEQLRERRRLEHVYEENRQLENLAGESYLGRWGRER